MLSVMPANAGIQISLILFLTLTLAKTNSIYCIANPRYLLAKIIFSYNHVM